MVSPKKTQETGGQHRRYVALGPIRNHEPQPQPDTTTCVLDWSWLKLLRAGVGTETVNSQLPCVTGKRQTAQLVKNIQKFLTVNT